jgi:hypothetical protein
LAGALAFRQKLVEQGPMASEFEDEPSSSLIGTHLLATGLATDIALLNEACSVLIVRKPGASRRAAAKRKLGRLK